MAQSSAYQLWLLADGRVFNLVIDIKEYSGLENIHWLLNLIAPFHWVVFPFLIMAQACLIINKVEYQLVATNFFLQCH